jgi:hypothetical protein
VFKTLLLFPPAVTVRLINPHTETGQLAETQQLVKPPRILIFGFDIGIAEKKIQLIPLCPEQGGYMAYAGCAAGMQQKTGHTQDFR